MDEKKRVDRVDLGVFERGKMVDVYAKEFSCTAAGKIQGNLDSEIAEIRGACKVGGNVRASVLKIGGSMKVQGDVDAELIRAKGAFKVEGNLSANNFRTSGASKVMGKIVSTEEIYVEGVLKCASDIDSEIFTLHGVVDVDGTLRAKKFTAELGGKSAIQFLESDVVHVTVGKNSNKPELLVKKITGKDIYLENTFAELVEGENVRIGPGCAISEVKSGNLEVHPSSKVGKRQN